MPTDSPALTSSIAARVLQQAFDLWITPEMDHRRAAGTLPEGFVLHLAQVILQPGEPPKVRLNNEVRVALKGQAKRHLKAGEPVVIGADIGPIEHITLLDEDTNAGHITVIRAGDGWWSLVPIWEPDQTPNPLRRWEPAVPYWAADA